MAAQPHRSGGSRAQGETAMTESDNQIHRYMEAAGTVEGRSAGARAGAQDLVALVRGCASLGQLLDLCTPDDRPVFLNTNTLFAALDSFGPMGTRAKERILNAHDLELACAIHYAELVRAGEIPVPVAV